MRLFVFRRHASSLSRVLLAEGGQQEVPVVGTGWNNILHPDDRQGSFCLSVETLNGNMLYYEWQHAVLLDTTTGE